MVKQMELSAFADLKDRADKLEAEIREYRERFVAASRANEPIEPGRLILKVTINDEAEKTAWKPVVERIEEVHPELRGAIASIVKANTKVAPYERVEVKARG